MCHAASEKCRDFDKRALTEAQAEGVRQKKNWIYTVDVFVKWKIKIL